ncbi:MAG TPA: glycosyltransferase family 2 protein [Chthoniobacterales bacterium]|nr:glycosyltransferase family 2 protein [Chthoniobacterales bacterium]
MGAESLSPFPSGPVSESSRRTLGRETKVSVVVPCYNEHDVLPLLYQQLSGAAQEWGVDYEIILVDDGSRDRTWEAMRAIHAADPRWKMIALSRNFGQQLALWTGLCAARGEIVVVLDADLQDPPEILPSFFTKWQEGFDVVYGVRQRRKEGVLKRAAYSLFYRVLSVIANVAIPLDTGDFCVMDRRVVRVLTSSRERRPFIRGMRAWAGFRQVALPYERRGRAAGNAKYTLAKLFRLAFDGILSSSIQPLRIASCMGVIVSGVAFLGVVFTLLQRIFIEQFAAIGLRPVPGFATTVIAILFLGGVQLFCMGILGEYIGRVFETVQGRPTTVIADSLGIFGADLSGHVSDPSPAEGNGPTANG